MKIAMLGHKRVPSREGGIEIVVEELATRLADLGHEVTLFNRYKKGFLKQKNYKNCRIKTIFTINKKSLDAIFYSFFATIIALFGKYDVIHVHAEGPCCFLWLTRFSKKKIVVTIHGLDWQRGKWGNFATRILKYGEKQAVKHADEIIVLSKNIQQYFLEKYNRVTTYISNGINKPVIAQADIIYKKYGLNKDDYILFLARIVPEKGAHYLIEAFHALSKENGFEKKLVIAGGDSHSKQYYEKLMNSCQNNDKIILTGFVDGQELAELYSNAYLYVLPSDIEGMPMTLLEAMSYGTICLVSSIPENTEVLSENNYIFEKGNITDLQAKLKKIIDLKIKAHNPQYLFQSWDMVVDQTSALYFKKGSNHE